MKNHASLHTRYKCTGWLGVKPTYLFTDMYKDIPFNVSLCSVLTSGSTAESGVNRSNCVSVKQNPEQSL